VFGFNFAPVGWAECNGQLLPISQNTALFSLLGTQFGGNGTTNFALPNLQGSFAVHQGPGEGLTPRSMGEVGGSATVTLNVNEMPTHNHLVKCSNKAGTTIDPTGAIFAAAPTGNPPAYAAATGPWVDLSPQAVSNAGGGEPHENMQPYQVLNFCIAMQGIYPPRS
jgi:microcystin-dependent protein